MTEDFGHPNSPPEAGPNVRAAAARLAPLGAAVAEVSIPVHRLAGAIVTPIAFEGPT